MHEDLFHRVYRENYQKVISLCLGFTKGDIGMSRDLAQETFIKVWENLGSFRNDSDISTWIYRIAVNTCLANSNRKNSVPVQKEIPAVEEPEDEQEKELQLESMYACIDGLSPINKSIILLELEQVPQQEIAGVIGISHEALRTRIHRIKLQLSKCVKKWRILKK